MKIALIEEYPRERLPLSGAFSFHIDTFQESRLSELLNVQRSRLFCVKGELLDE